MTREYRRPLGFQPTCPLLSGDDDYHCAAVLVNWQDVDAARELTSADEVEDTAADGEVELEETGTVVAMPEVDLATRRTLMVGLIGRDEVQRLVDERQAIVAEVLPRPEYDWAHLPGAVHLPLKGWTIEQIHAGLDRERPVIVYCNDYQ